MSDVVPGAGAIDAAAGGQTAEQKFTQQDVERIIAERLSRQKAQFADYDELKQKAAKWAEVEEAQKSEAQKTAERLATLERERDAALAVANERLIKSAFVAEAAAAGALHPEDVFALANKAGVQVDDQGNVVGVTEAVKAIVEAGRIPLAANRPTPPRLDGGAGSGGRQAEKDAPLTDDEQAMAQRLGLSAEKYAARKVELKRAADARR
jgi:hypothetical protein